MQAAKFLHMLHIYRTFDLPYQSQIVPLAAIGLKVTPFTVCAVELKVTASKRVPVVETSLVPDKA